jgi:hypothetical protein
MRYPKRSGFELCPEGDSGPMANPFAADLEVGIGMAWNSILVRDCSQVCSPLELVAWTLGFSMAELQLQPAAIRG